MTEHSDATFLLAMAIGMVLMLAGFYALKALDPPMLVRVCLGGAMFAIGVVAIAIWPGASVVVEDPVQLGVVVVLLGLGINQLAAPLRRAFGKAA